MPTIIELALLILLGWIGLKLLERDDDKYRKKEPSKEVDVEPDRSE